MDSPQKLRSDDIRPILHGQLYMEESEFVSKSKLQNAIRPTISKDDASLIVAKELPHDLIVKNVYPAEERSVAKSILREYETFRDLRKTDSRTDRPKPDKWFKKVQDFNERMIKRAFDIRAHSRDYEKQLSVQYNVQMTKDDEDFYTDNCHGDYLAKCTSTIPRNWAKQQKRNVVRDESMNCKRIEMETDLQRDLDIKAESMRDDLTDSGESESGDMDYTATSECEPSDMTTTRSTRSVISNDADNVRDGFSPYQSPH